MKLHNKTLLELRFKLELSEVGTCAACSAAMFHDTDVYAKQAVAKHRAISKEIRESVSALLKDLNRYDARVETELRRVNLNKLGVPDGLS